MEQCLRKQLIGLKEKVNAGSREEDSSSVSSSSSETSSTVRLLEKSHEDLKELITSRYLDPGDGKNTINELCILCSEVAASLQRFDIATICIDDFFMHDPPQNQFYCRALFIRGMLDGEKAKLLHGDEASCQLVKAVGHIIKSFNICLLDENVNRYQFLIYNGTIHLWNIMRPLFRPGLRHLSIPGLSKSLECISKTINPDPIWTAKLNSALALALDETGNKKGALEKINISSQQVKKFTEDDQEDTKAQNSSDEIEKLRLDIERISFHLSGQNAVDVARKEKRDGNYFPLIQCIRSGFLSAPEVENELLSMLEEIKTAASKDDIELQDPVDPVATEPQIDTDKFNKYIPNVNSTSHRPLQPEQLNLIVVIGRLAIQFDLENIIETCIDIGSNANAESKTPRFEIEYDYLSAEWSIVKHEKKERNLSAESNPADVGGRNVNNSRKLAGLGIAKRVDALKLLSRSIQSCKFINDVPLLEEGCILAWNISMPLLQPHLRKYVHQTFQIASSALEEVDSQQSNLRAHLHCELAKCELAADFLSKASSQVNKALTLDYGIHIANLDSKKQDSNNKGKKLKPEKSIDDPNKLEDKRNLDKFLLPLKKRLDLKSNIYKEPDTKFEQAVLQVEQAKDSQDVHLTKTLLNRASVLLDESSKEITSTSTEADPENQKTFIWGEVAKLSWEKKLLPITRKAATRVITPCSFDSSSTDIQAEMDQSTDDQSKLDKNLAILLAQTHFILAETFVHQIKTAFVHEECPRMSGLSARALGMDVPKFRERNSQVNESKFSKSDEEIGEQEVNLPSWDNDEPPYERDLISWKNELIKHIIAGMKTGIAIKENWIIENAVVYLWNYHLHFFYGPLSRFQYMLPSLCSAIETTFYHVSEATNKDPETFCSLCFAYCRILEYQKNTTKAADIAKTGLQIAVTVEQSKFLLSTLQRVQRKNGIRDPPEAPSLNQGGAAGKLDIVQAEKYMFSVIELTLLSEDLVPTNEKLELLSKAISVFEDYSEKSAYRHEIWTKLGRSAFDLEDLKVALICIEKAGNSLPTKSKARFSKADLEAFQWMSIAYCLWGQIIMKKTNPITQSNAKQDQLLQEALSKFCEAAALGALVGLPALVLDAASNMWNVSVIYVGSKTTRTVLLQPFRLVLKELFKFKGALGMELSVRFLHVIFDCLKDKEDWNAGLALAESMMPNIPTSLQKPLWEARVIFSSKLGRDAAAALYNMKGNSESLQAKSWLTLARASTAKEDQLAAYLEATEILQGNPESVEYMIELGEWLYLNDFASMDVCQVLYASADTILDIETNNVGDETMSINSASQYISKSGENSMRAPSTAVRSVIGTGMSNQRQSRAISRRSSMSKVTKGSTTGSRDFRDNDQTAETISVNQYLYLVQIFTMLARVSESCTQRRAHLMLAHSHVLNVWKIFFQQFNQAITKGNTMDAENESRQENQDDKSSQISEQEDCENVQSWVSFDVREYLNSKGNKTEERFSVHDFLLQLQRVPIILHYLFELSDLLISNSLEMFSLPVFHLIKVLSTDTPDPTMRYIHKLGCLRIAKVLDSLNVSSYAIDQENEAMPFLLPEADRIHYLVEVERLEQQNAQGYDTQFRSSDSLKGTDIQPVILSNTARNVIIKIEVRHVWTLLALEYIDLGLVREAQVLLNEVRRHNFAFRDLKNSSIWGQAQAKLNLLKGEPERAVAYIIEAIQCQRKAGGVDLQHWKNSIFTLVECLHLLGQRNEIKEHLRGSITVLENMKRTEDLDRKLMMAKLFRKLAQEYTKDACRKIEHGMPWNDLWFESEKLFKQSIKILAVKTSIGDENKNWEDIEYINSLLEYGIAALELSRFSQMKSLIDTSLLSLCDAKSCCEKLLHSCRPMYINSNMYNLPVARKFAKILIALGDAELERGRILGILKSQKLKEKSDHNKNDSSGELDLSLDVANKWLKETAPPPELMQHEKCSSCEERACMFFMGAYSNAGGVEAMQSEVTLKAGSGLAECGMVDAAMKLFQQAIRIGTAFGQFEIVEKASWEMYKILDFLPETPSFHQKNMMVESLLLYQSCKSRSWLAHVIENISGSSSKLALFVRQHKQRKRNLLQPFRNKMRVQNPNMSSSDIEDSASDTEGHLRPIDNYLSLSNNTAWNMIDYSETVSEILEPCIKGRKLCVLSLVFSPREESICSSFVTYANESEIERSNGNDNGKGDSNLDDGDDIKCVASRTTSISKQTLNSFKNLEARISSFQRQIGSFLIDYGNDHGPEGDYYRKLSIQNEENNGLGLDENGNGDGRSSEDKMEDELNKILLEFKQLISPCVLNIVQSAGIRNVQVLEDYHLVILCGKELCCFPLEVLPDVISPGLVFRSVVRDFSLHLFSKRSQYEHSPGLKKVNYIVDPKHEDASGVLKNAIQQYVSINKKSEQEWCGFPSNSSRIPSIGEWQTFIKHSSGDRMKKDMFSFLYIGLSHLLSHFDPEALIGLNLKNCQQALLIDRAHNDSSLGCQNKEELTKSLKRLTIEEPIGTAAVLSLVGVRTIMLQQWNNTISINSSLVSSTLELLDKKGISTGEAVEIWKSQVDDDTSKSVLKNRVKFNTIVYGLPY